MFRPERESVEATEEIMGFSSHSEDSYSSKRGLFAEHPGKETSSTMPVAASTCQGLDYIIQIQIHFSALLGLRELLNAVKRIH